jgi:hypothetical protein
MSETEQISSHSARLFADKYQDATSEKQLGQSFWRDFFLTVVGVSDLLVAGIEFEFPIRGKTGTIKFIDCLWPGVVLVEHKSAGKDLDVAEEQARDYLEALPTHLRPPTLIVSDFRAIRIVNILRGSSHDFPLTELPENLDRVHAVIAYDGATSAEPRVEADKKAVKLMGELFIQFEKAGYEGHELSVFLIRILFLNFGDDTRMWKYTPEGLFGASIQDTYPDGTGLGGRIQELFQVLNTPRDKRPSTLSPALVDFPYVNGGLFSEQLPIFSFTADMREALIATTRYDWSNISPAIFGAMFQTVKDKADRRESGEFYTSEKAIMRVISPLFLDGLNARLQKAWASAPALKRLWADVGKMNFLDPASGSGNFLLVAYKKLRELELKLMARLNELEGRDTAIQIDGSIGLQVHLGQFHAIEYDEWSSQIAFVAMFLADHQSNRQMEEILGVSPERFPLTESAVVKQGNALTIPWDTVCPMNENTYIMGNPPFNGSSMLSPEQRQDTSSVWKGMKGSGLLDYVTNWFVMGAQWASERGARVGFVATNSITQGEQPALLWGKLLEMGVGIDFAYRSFWWDNGAAVHVVIIGFSTQPKPKKRPLWKFSEIKSEPELTWADNINPYLIDAANVLVSARTSPIIPVVQKMDYGSKPTDNGSLSNISSEEANLIRESDPVAAKYLKRLVGAREIIHNTERYCFWLVGAEPSDIRNSPELAKRVQAVRVFRSGSPKAMTQRDAERPNEFQEIRQPTTAYLAVPLHSSETRDYVPIARFDADTITNNSLSLVPDGSLRTFGVLMSSPFNVWNKTVSGRLKSDTRISGTITYNNFPFPDTTAAQDEAIEAGSQAVLSARALFPTSSLADLYDPKSMPSELRKAHQQLDKAVLAAFGLKISVSDEEVLAELFTRYDELTRGLLDATTVPKRKAKKTA